jgi:hypothetical protein
MADEDVSVRFGASIGELLDGVEGVKGSIEGLGETFTHLAEIAGVALSVDAFKEWVAASADLGEEMERTAAKLGVTAEQAGELQGVAKLTGTSFQGMQTAMERLGPQLAQAETGSGRVAAALKALGLNAHEMVTASTLDRINLLAAAVSRFPDSQTKTDAVQALGRSFIEMLPALDRGVSGINELRNAWIATGAVLTNDQAAAFAKTKEDIELMGGAFQGLSNKLFDILNAPIDAAINEITRLLEKMNPAGIRSGIESVAGAAVDLAATVETFAVRAAAAVQDLIASFGGMGQFIKQLEAVNDITIPGHFKEGAEALMDLVAGKEGGDEQLADAAAETAKRAQDLDERLKSIQQSAAAAKVALTAAFNPPSTAPEMDMINGGKKQVSPLDLGAAAAAKQAVDEITKAFSREVQQAQDTEKGVATTLNNELKLHQITESQWLAQTNAALDAEAMAVINAADKATASTLLSSDQKKAIWDKEEHDLAQIADEEANAQAKAAEEAAAAWKSFANQTAGIINSQVDGVLKGTTSIRQAFKNMAVSAIEDMIKWAIKTMAENAAVVTAHLAGNAEMGASDASLGAGSLLSTLSSVVQAIAKFAGQTAAGVSAFLAPIVGPAAPAVGAAAGATVAAMGNLYDAGSWEIPHDQIAGVHAGEMIIPQRGGVADEFRSFMGGGGFGGSRGGDTHNWNISSNSADPREVAKEIARIWNSQPTTRATF